MKEKTVNSAFNNKIQWHPGFYSAIQLDWISFKNDFTFADEYTLNRKPLQIDLLIIKHNPDKVTDNDIAGFFRIFNIIEYKSPEDALNIDVFYKGIGYGCLLKSKDTNVNEIKTSDITVTFIRSCKPKGLIRLLTKEGYTITEYKQGIYHVS